MQRACDQLFARTSFASYKHARVRVRGALNLSEQEKIDLVAYMEALTSPAIALELPSLPISILPTPYIELPEQKEGQIFAGSDE